MAKAESLDPTPASAAVEGARASDQDPDCVETQSSERDENEVLKIDLKTEAACGVGIQISAA
jgi:hypothetical protein